MLPCFNLAEKMLVSSLLEADAGPLVAGCIDLGGKHQNSDVIFEAANNKFPLVAIV